MRLAPQGRWSRYAGPAIIVLAAAVAVAPQLVRANSCGHDFDFHLVSWFDTLDSWRHGIFYPHWTPSANFGAGEPRFIFYPPLTWMLGAALGLALPWQLVPTAMAFLFLTATGLATRFLALEILSDGFATLAGCAALYSGYGLFSVYERSAFGELTGGFWIPLLLLYILRSSGPSGTSSAMPAWKRVLGRPTLPLALVVAGAWMSNAPVGVMACYLLAAIALAVAALERSWTPILRASWAAFLGLGLAAIYLIPAAWEQRWVDIHQATGDPGERIENSWLFGRHSDPQLALHDAELHRASLIAVTMIAVALGGVLLWRIRSKFAGENRPVPQTWWIPLALIAPAVLILQLPVSLELWNLLPKLRFLQFPWRWLVVLEAPMGIFFALAVRSIWPGRRWLRAAMVPVCALAFAGASAGAGRYFFQPCDDEDAVAAMLAVYRTGGGFQGTDEYAPPDADDSVVPTGLPDACLVADPEKKLGIFDSPGANPDWWIEQGSCDQTLTAQLWQQNHKRIRAVVLHPGYLILRLRDYPAWRIAVNGQAIGALPEREDGLMAVPVPKGPVELAVDWTTTADVLAGRWVSALSVLLLTGLWLLERKPNHARLS